MGLSGLQLSPVDPWRKGSTQIMIVIKACACNMHGFSGRDRGHFFVAAPRSWKREGARFILWVCLRPRVQLVASALLRVKLDSDCSRTGHVCQFLDSSVSFIEIFSLGFSYRGCRVMTLR